MDYKVKDRMVQFLKHLGMGQGAFEAHVGLSNGLISKIKDGLHRRSIEKIKTKYPELNTTWLLTGEGEMLITDDKESDPKKMEASQIQNLPGDDITKQILLNLSESHKNLAAAHADIAASNKILMEKENVTAGVGEETLEAFGEKLEVLLEAIISVATGKKWSTADEARAELRRTVDEKQTVLKKSGIPTG